MLLESRPSWSTDVKVHQDRKIARWERGRSRGKVTFVLCYGPAYAAALLPSVLIGRYLHGQPITPIGVAWIAPMLIGLSGGFCMALLNWKDSERWYKKQIATRTGGV